MALQRWDPFNELRRMEETMNRLWRGFSTGDERMQAHLPLLLHPSPRRVAFLGLGTGITAGAAVLHPVDDVTAVELIPEVVANDPIRRNSGTTAKLKSVTVRIEVWPTILSAGPPPLR